MKISGWTDECVNKRAMMVKIRLDVEWSLYGIYFCSDKQRKICDKDRKCKRRGGSYTYHKCKPFEVTFEWK